MKFYTNRRKSGIQGEGGHDAANKYGGQAAKAAAPRNAQTQEGMRRAGTEGRPHAEDDRKAGRNDDSPGRPKPEKKAPGRHPEGRDPIPEKAPGR